MEQAIYETDVGLHSLEYMERTNANTFSQVTDRMNSFRSELSALDRAGTGSLENPQHERLHKHMEVGGWVRQTELACPHDCRPGSMCMWHS